MGRRTDDLDVGNTVASLVGNEVIAPGVHRTVLISVDQLAAALAPTTVRPVFATRAAMDGALGYPANAGAEVHADPTKANNGLYRKTGAAGTGAWVKVSDLTTVALADRTDTLERDVGAHAEALAVTLTQSQAASSVSRPGDVPALFTSAGIDGGPEDLAPLTVAPTLSAYGSVIPLGSGRIAPRRITSFEPYRQYRLRIAFQRLLDPEQPPNGVLRVFMRWLKADKSGLKSDLLEQIDDLVVASGRQIRSYVIGHVATDNVDFVVPAEATSGRPYVESFGSALTGIEVIEVTDLSETADWSPDVSSLINGLSQTTEQVSGLTGRVSALQGQVAALVDRQGQRAFASITQDADLAVQAADGVKTVLDQASLTQPRALYLSTASAMAGDRINITRLASDPYARLVHGASIKALTAGTWGEWVFDGEAWLLRASGNL